MISKELNYSCPVCGKKFHVKPYRISHSKNICCCMACSALLKSRLYKEKCNDSRTEKICPICGKHFKTYNINQIYCSNKCYSQNRYKNSTNSGIGLNDLKGEKLSNIKNIRYIWKNMIKRCYNEAYQQKHKSYIGCSVCDEWRIFSNFYNWAITKYKTNFAIDKDILVKGNKIYSPDTCCFVPQEINSLFISQNNENVGIEYTNHHYVASFSAYNKKHYVGSFDTIEKAKLERAKAREKYIIEMADKYKNDLDSKVYNTIINYYKFQG